MVKLFSLKSPDEWATTKQACRDTYVVTCFLPSTIRISVSTLIKKIKICSNHYKLSGSRWGGVGVLPHMAYTGMCRRTGYGFLPLCPKQGI